VGPGGGEPGDLFVEIVQTEHPVFERRGDDLVCTVEVPMTAAALGTGIELETLDGVEQVEVRPGTQPGAVLTLRARGVPHLRGSGRGDLHIQLDVRTPTRLDAEQEGFLRSLARARGEEGVTLRATEQVADETGGFFSRLRGAFSGR
jgi:molecular chaperone DnaJ